MKAKNHIPERRDIQERWGVSLPVRQNQNALNWRANTPSLLSAMLLLMGTLLLSGCVAVDNPTLTKLPFFEARSDTIPGLDSPHQRKKAIQEKGKKGAAASESEREILVAQLMWEYQTCPDPNMRREAVDALAMIPHPDRDRYLQEILKDEEPFVRLSALEALGKTFSGNKEDLMNLLLNQIKTDTDKDVRLSSVKILGNVCQNRDKSFGDAEIKLRESIALELGELLQDRVTAIRYEAMVSLHKVTGKDYGHDVNRWLQYVRYMKGEVPDLPAERSMSEKVPNIALPMFK